MNKFTWELSEKVHESKKVGFQVASGTFEAEDNGRSHAKELAYKCLGPRGKLRGNWRWGSWRKKSRWITNQWVTHIFINDKVNYELKLTIEAKT